MGISDFLISTKVVEERDSAVNGKITVIKSLAFGTYIQVNNLTQSGGVVVDVWRTTLRKIKKLVNKKMKNLNSQNSKNQETQFSNCLILGMGAGSAAGLVKKYWPEIKLTGVELDPIFIEMGKKYLRLEDLGAEIIIEDAEKFVKKSINENKKYDLVLIDMYLGDEVPKKFQSENFINQVKRLLSKNGVCVFNRLYYGDKRKQAIKFSELLERRFGEVTLVYPEANVMYICNA